MPLPVERRLILEHIDQPGYTPDIACYLKHGGYADLRKAVAMEPSAIVDEVKKLPVLDDRSPDEIIGYNERGYFD